MALNQAEKEAKVVEIKEKEIEIEAFDTETQTGAAAIRTEYDYQGMLNAINDYTASRASAKAALDTELQTLKSELVAE